MNAQVERAVQEAGDHPIIEKGARAGYAASGLLHLVLAWITAQLALGNSSQEASQGGALQSLANNPVGGALLWTITVAFALLVLWQISEALAWRKTRWAVHCCGPSP